MSISNDEMRILFESGTFNSIEWHEDRIRKQEEVVKLAEVRLKKALAEEERIEKELSDIKKELEELREKVNN